MPKAAGVRRLQHGKVTTLVSPWLINEEYYAAALHHRELHDVAGKGNYTAPCRLSTPLGASTLYYHVLDILVEKLFFQVTSNSIPNKLGI